MGMVEAEARVRGCTLVYLDTFTFQAPRLYQRLGFEIACSFEGFPDDIVKFVLRKQIACNLEPSAQGGLPAISRGC